MSHWAFAPLLLPLLAGIALLLFDSRDSRPRLQRRLSLSAASILLVINIGVLLSVSAGDYLQYALGNWPAPYGIVLVVDRLAALMLLLTAVVALVSLAYAIHSETDRRGRHFHALFQFQLLGLNGAFITGDLFNLFVFFEILLIASYGLLLHGGGRELARAGLHYVVLNLIGSALFLIAIGVLYGTTGTLNMADLALRIADAEPSEAGLLQAAALLLLVVFGLKAALLPLYFWLPNAYALTTAAVAALFAIMTKVGVYAIVRVFTLMFGEHAGVAANVADFWLLPLALATVLTGAVGCLAAHDLRRLLAYLIVVSVGTMLTAVGLFTESGLSAAFVYLIHSTLIGAAMFIVADLILRQRGTLDFRSPILLMSKPLLIGSLFFVGAVSLIGLPPLSGFLAKLMILRAAIADDGVNAVTAWTWALLLLSGLFSLIALARGGSTLFWRPLEAGAQQATGTPAALSHCLPTLGLIAVSPLLVILALPVTEFAQSTARQLLDPNAYIGAVLGADAVRPTDR